jgi:hypothetical protein
LQDVSHVTLVYAVTSPVVVAMPQQICPCLQSAGPEHSKGPTAQLSWHSVSTPPGPLADATQQNWPFLQSLSSSQANARGHASLLAAHVAVVVPS